LSVFGASTLGGRPATVTNPGLVGCLNCRWLERWRSRHQPSASISLITSRTVTVKPRRNQAPPAHFNGGRNRATRQQPGTRPRCWPSLNLVRVVGLLHQVVRFKYLRWPLFPFPFSLSGGQESRPPWIETAGSPTNGLRRRCHDPGEKASKKRQKPPWLWKIFSLDSENLRA
jgi:hypothetical protein